MRITSQAMVRSALQNLQANMNRLSELQDKASSQRAINRPSDDPIATASAIRVKGEQRALDQYQRNIDDGNGWMATVESSLASVTQLMNRVRDLTVQGANDGAMSPDAKEAIAVELESLRDELLAKANSTYQGRTVFAGNSDAGVAFDAVPPYGFSGTASDSVQRRIDANTTVRVDADGSSVFGTGTDPESDEVSVFALIDTIAAELRAGVNVSERIAQIDTRMGAIREQQAVVGARQAQLQHAEETNMDRSVSLEAQRSGIEDVDLARVILDLQVQQNTYQAALAVTSRVLQPTLMDFLR